MYMRCCAVIRLLLHVYLSLGVPGSPWDVCIDSVKAQKVRIREKKSKKLNVCKKRIAEQEDYERRYTEALAAENARLEREPAPEIVAYDPTKTAQALTFDSLGLPYTISPYVGPVVAKPGEATHGKWTYADDGAITLRNHAASSAVADP